MKTERVRVREKRNRQKKTQKWQKKTNPSRCIPTRGNHVYQTFRTIVTKPLQSAYKIMRACGYTIQWRIQGGQSGHGNHRSWQWSLVPRGPIRPWQPSKLAMEFGHPLRKNE